MDQLFFNPSGIIWQSPITPKILAAGHMP